MLTKIIVKSKMYILPLLTHTLVSQVLCCVCTGNVNNVLCESNEKLSKIKIKFAYYYLPMLCSDRFFIN